MKSFVTNLLVASSNMSDDLFFLLSSIPLLTRICVRDLVVAADLWVPDPLSRYLGSLLRQLVTEQVKEDDTFSSFQNHPGSTQKLCEVMSSNCGLGP